MKNTVKKMICLIITLSTILALSTTGFAIEAGDSFKARFPEEFVAPDYIYTEADLQNIRAENPTSPADTRATTYVASFSNLTTTQMETVIEALGAGDILRSTYNGTEVYKFTSGGNTICIPSAQLYRATSGTCSRSSFNSALTNAANITDTEPIPCYVFSSYQYSWNGNTIYRFNISKLTGQAYYNSTDNLYFKIRVEETIGIDVYSTFIFGTTYTGTAEITPSCTYKITNTGSSSNRLYMGGYELEGFGRNTSRSNMGDLISLGYKATEMFGSVTSGLTTKTLLALFNDAVSLNNSLAVGGRNYFAEPSCLSNPARGVYAYTCATESPFVIQKDDDYMIIKIGLVGTPNSSTRYSVSTAFSVEG